MVAALVFLVLVLTFFIVVLLFVAANREAKQGPPPMQTKTLREIERALGEIQSLSNDIYARGKAEQTLQKVRMVLDRDYNTR